jgi:hypothetical protein
MEAFDAKRLCYSEAENSKLKGLLADTYLDVHTLRNFPASPWVSFRYALVLGKRLKASAAFVYRCILSERLSQRALGGHRSNALHTCQE